MDKLTLSKETLETIGTASLESFITNYFKYGSPSTYTSDGKLQTVRGKYRSFSDIVVLAKTYFDCTEEDVAKIIISLWEQKKIGSLFCDGINKVVFHKDIPHSGSYINVQGFEIGGIDGCW